MGLECVGLVVGGGGVELDRGWLHRLNSNCLSTGGRGTCFFLGGSGTDGGGGRGEGRGRFMD